MTGIRAYGEVFSYYAEYEQRNPQTEAALTNEFWLQNMLNHPYAPPCYTLDATLCATAVEVETHGDARIIQKDFLPTVECSAVPALICAGVMGLLVWNRRRRKALDQQPANVA